MTETARVTACLIIIGNEILSGRTQDRNLAYLATWANRLGVQLAEVRVIPDVEEKIVETVNHCRGHFDYVFTTGGIGPTHDDITAASVAKAFGVPLERNAEAVALLGSHYVSGELTESRLKMADVPQGARLIANPISKAPGFQIGNVFVLAGVPQIMQVMLDGISDRISGGATMLSRQILCYLAEGRIASGLAAIQDRHPRIEIGSYPFWKKQRFGVTVVLRGVDAREIDRAAEEVRDLIDRLGGKPLDEGSEVA